MTHPLIGIRRYPVKSMGGEDLATAALDERGLDGDRWWAVSDREGHLASGKSSRRFRRRDGVFDYRAATGRDGVTVTGARGTWSVGDPALDEELACDARRRMSSGPRSPALLTRTRAQSR